MKKLFLISILIFLLGAITTAQTDKTALVPKPKDTTPVEAGKVGKDKDSTFNKKNAIDLQFLGNSLIFTLNYERSFYKSFLGSDKICLRVGFLSVLSETIIPVSIANIYGAKKNAFEVGFGLTADITDVSKISPSLNTYYRYQSNNKFLFRVGISIISNTYISESVIPMPGISFGWSF